MKLLWIAFSLLTTTIAMAQDPAQKPAQKPAQSPDTSVKAQLSQAVSYVLTSYNNATDYSATIVTKYSEGKEYQTTTLHVTLKNDLKKGYVSSGRFERQLDIATKKMTQRTTDLTVDDGKSIIQMYPAQHSYADIPHEQSRISDLLYEPLHKCLVLGVPLTAAQRKLDGRDYDEIIGNGAKGKVDILIDHETIRVRLIHLEVPHGAGTRVIDINVKDEQFGKDVPATKFDTTPPSSFKKVSPIEDPDPWD